MADMQDILNSSDMADGNDLRSKTDKAVGRLISRFSGADESRKIVKRVLNNVIVFMGAGDVQKYEIAYEKLLSNTSPTQN